MSKKLFSPCGNCGYREDGCPYCTGQLACSMCGDPPDPRYNHEAKHAGRGDLLICGSCADLVANAFNLVHAGVPITWPRAGEKDGESASLLNSKGKIRGEVRRAVMERDQYRCCGCGTWLDLTVDHIHPVSKGGTDDLANLQTLCRSCNSKKGNRT